VARRKIPVLPSRVTVEGLDRAPHRAFLRSLGVGDADLGKPFVGVASTDGRVTPCNALLGEFAREACAGVRAAGGVPFDFASVSVADSMSMNHAGMRFSLVSRELIADGVEAVVRGHAYDALVAFAGCDKTLPGMMMALVRLNLPGAFVYGGAALPGRWHGRDVTVLDTYEGVGAVLAGDMPQAELDQLERACLPTLGSCPGQFTANTMAMVSETLGLAQPGTATLPAVAAERGAGEFAQRECLHLGQDACAHRVVADDARALVDLGLAGLELRLDQGDHIPRCPCLVRGSGGEPVFDDRQQDFQ